MPISNWTEAAEAARRHDVMSRQIADAHESGKEQIAGIKDRLADQIAPTEKLAEDLAAEIERFILANRSDFPDGIQTKHVGSVEFSWATSPGSLQLLTKMKWEKVLVAIQEAEHRDKVKAFKIGWVAAISKLELPDRIAAAIEPLRSVLIGLWRCAASRFTPFLKCRVDVDRSALLAAFRDKQHWDAEDLQALGVTFEQHPIGSWTCGDTQVSDPQSVSAKAA